MTATNERYNGWKNRETWNLMLWLDNDFSNYSQYRGWLRNSTEKPTRAKSIAFVNTIYQDGITPDFDCFREDKNAIDWDEITDAFCTEWEEMKETES